MSAVRPYTVIGLELGHMLIGLRHGYHIWKLKYPHLTYTEHPMPAPFSDWSGAISYAVTADWTRITRTNWPNLHRGRTGFVCRERVKGPADTQFPRILTARGAFKEVSTQAGNGKRYRHRTWKGAGRRPGEYDFACLFGGQPCRLFG